MGTKTKEVGGGPATGLANDFTKWLQAGLTSGTFGGGTAAYGANNANPVANTAGISGVLNDILAGGGGNIGGSLAELISKDTERQAAALRARFGAGGGTGYGSGASLAEAQLRSESAPKLTAAVGQLQLQALAPILSALLGISGKGISQREVVATPSTGAQILGTVAPVLGAVAGGPLGAGLAGMLGMGASPFPAMPNIIMPQIPIPQVPGYN